MRRTRKYFKLFALMSLLVVLQAYQNCGNIALQAIPKEKNLGSTDDLRYANLKGTYCSQLGSSPGSPMKFVFAVDMSASNIGEFTPTGFDTSKGTDKTGARFDAIQAFIQSCGSKNPDNEFAITAFSSTIVFPTNGVCRGQFKKSQDALTAVAALRTMQSTSLNALQASSSAVTPMKKTSYEDGLDCARDAVTDDARNVTTKKPSYFIFFLSDGSPTQKENNATCLSGSPNFAKCFGDMVSSILDEVSTLGAPAKLQPIFYGDNPPQAAVDTMTVLAEAGKVDSYFYAKDSGQIPFCDLTSKPELVGYSKSRFLAMNLTTIMKEGWLHADSDADGVDDETERKSQLNPASRRSFGFFDSVCVAVGGASLCPQAFEKLGACSLSANNVGLTDCDLKSLSLDEFTSSQDKGVDSDGDDIPDIIEILRGMDPTKVDALLDYDSDGFANTNELLRGGQVQIPDREIRPELAPQISEQMVQNVVGCPIGQEAYEFTANHILLLPNQAFQDNAQRPATQGRDRKYLDMSHQANENVILLVYKVAPKNVGTDPSEVWGTYVKVNRDVYRGNPIELKPTDFFLLGEVASGR